ncbi:MAG: ATP-binding cassette domain-containing protein [Firmicutes bacterium]|nr:ATP-binding cassette domain-containing protein [Bacillota bacterium]
MDVVQQPPSEPSSSDPSAADAFHIEGMFKSFGETRVLQGVGMTLSPGSVHGLVGANGAGKSTLMRILAGELRPDAGMVRVKAHSYESGEWSAALAKRAGIAMVHQEVPVFANLMVYEHFAMVHGGGGGRWPSRAKAVAREALGRAFPGCGFGPTSKVGDLTLAQRQMLEISLAVSLPSLRVLILDEPTSALAREQVDELRTLIADLRARGVTVLLVTHRLEEVLSLCDVITVLRDGVVASSGPSQDFDEHALIQALGGGLASEARSASVERSAADAGEVLIRVPATDEHDIELTVRRGEVVGLSGLSGSGQVEVLRRVLGERKGGTAHTAALVSGDRRGQGLFPLWSTLRNLTFGSLRGLRRLGLIDRSAEQSLYKKWRERLRIRVGDPDDVITTLSGGNQQKVLIARALAAEPDVLLLDDPTRGVDAAAKAEFYESLQVTSREGRAVLWYSTEDDEMTYCDRVYVMQDGHVRRVLERRDVDRAAIVAASFARASEDSGNRGADDGRKPVWIAGLTQGWSLVAFVVVALIVAVGFAQSSALSPSGLPILVSSFTPLVFAAAAEMAVIAVSDIDLGLGAFMGLINAVSATLLVHQPALGVIAIVGFGLLYVLQAVLVELRRVPAIIVTLGASFIWLGIALMILPAPGGTAPNWLMNLGNLNVPVVPEPLLLAAAVAVIGSLVMFRTRIGVRIRAIGNSPDNYRAREGGRRGTLRVRLVAYAMAAVFAILAGLSMTALTSSADATASQPDTLLAIAAVIIGGATFVGGKVEPAGAILGALMFGLLEAFLGLTPINVNYTSLIEGSVLIVVLALRLAIRREVRT